MTLSYKVGSLQVREEELSSMLKLKVHHQFQCGLCDVSLMTYRLVLVPERRFPRQDKDVVEASGHIIELTVRLRELEALLKESRSGENKLQKDLEEMKRRHREAKQGLSQLKGERANPVASPKDRRLVLHLPLGQSVNPAFCCRCRGAAAAVNAEQHAAGGDHPPQTGAPAASQRPAPVW